ncbi:hypothetical protein FNF29_05010 [Cafeteria roenbergensis]|uniref:Cytochrome b5 heme-binding domain-containing protein n=1 Tax=Cafeteria roenbergensis TaxID=33653 RepID=A0A5A8D855_CAFRO|nr:hypothetical protein FNF29_05010 [Cafeteria roenbergensis]KAA0154825.1 hypothetical protein FNF31_06244 [Cafeteria roenbergensis]KAA0160794.1 hypothetical protein FNF28_05318 [Cafeteria roenbergensis]|eukprot:KAA0150896.1 hypothetical protein FNF29_05010 [Cafeteria roenbergensis]
MRAGNISSPADASTLPGAAEPSARSAGGPTESPARPKASFEAGLELEGARTLDWKEVRKHSTCEDLWVVIDDEVYDVTEWAAEHPGGREMLLKLGGMDASDPFHGFHLPRVLGRLARFRVGSLSAEAVLESAPSGATQAYRKLRARLWREGWFKVDHSFYVGRHAIWMGLIASGIAVALCGPGGWGAAALGGALVGLGIQQSAFIAHDAAHRGVIPSRPGGGFNFLAWALGGPIFGASMGMWNEEHNLHHAVTMRLHEDPQFDYLPIWLTSEREVTLGGYSLDWLGSVLIPIQHFTFLPVSILVGRVTFHLISFIHASKAALFGHNSMVRFEGAMDVAGMLVYWMWYSFVVSSLPTAAERTAFVLCNVLCVGILHVQLLLSHLAMERFTAEEEQQMGFFESQLRTSRNIDAPTWLDNVFHGGLEYQIEHHLFPMLPRHNFARAKPLVKEICDKHGITYHSSSFPNAIALCLADLRRLATAVVTLEMG